ncbi:ATP-binding protein [Paracoccus methylovorus]|uniref:ATP-binding protein n=1 Tax=Paracoccus methylovorus TaxID=2812658 RepID=A0ABX7JKQ7_9RHOB|nr:ATP-binding protein [Paracoccus methylovorus]
MKCDWIPYAWNILISGETGTGKSWIACCVATAVVRAGHKLQNIRPALRPVNDPGGRGLSA